MQKLKSFWRSSTSAVQTQVNSQLQQQTSFLQVASSLISSYRRPVMLLTTTQFDEYLLTIPQQYKKFKKSYLNTKQNKKVSYQSLKPQLVRKVYQNVDQQYFQTNFVVGKDFFNHTKKANRQKQLQIHQHLDEVEVALFNQITARFDQILSVLRTVESLDCLIQYNLDKIRTIRHVTLNNTKKVSQKQVKIVRLSRKQSNLQKTLKCLQQLKAYQKFIQKSKSQNDINSSLKYQSIQQLKNNLPFFNQLNCCSQIFVQIQQSQFDLKRSFSDTLNQIILQYTVGKISTYRKGFWDRFRYKNDILEEDQQADNQATVILDQSAIIQDQSMADQPILTLNQEEEALIIKNIARGWNQGEYAVGGIKSIIQKHIKTTHNKFLDDYRQFCLNYLSRQQRQVTNPCLQELLQQFHLSFFTRCCTYYSSLFQPLLYRLSSITFRNIQYILNLSIRSNDQNEQLNIEQKEKLTQLLDGMMNVFIFIWKSVQDKLVQLLEHKEIHDTNDISDFRAFITITQNFHDFINKRLIHQFNDLQCPQTSFLYQKYNQMKGLLPIKDILYFKKAKLIQYLSKIHKNAIQIELRQSLQKQSWSPTDIPTFYYDSLHYIITGESLNLRRNRGHKSMNTTTSRTNSMYDTSVLMQSMYIEKSILMEKQANKQSNFRIIRTDIMIEGQTFKITETILLLLQIVQDYMLLSQFYPEIQQEIAIKLTEMFRTYNSSSLQLIVHAGAVALGKIKTKSITAKHLALSTLCLRFCLFILDCIKNRIKMQDFDKIYKDIEEHSQTTTRKLQSILKSKISQSLPQIKLQTSPSKGTQAIVNSCKILHDILIDFFSTSTLKKIFTKQIATQYVNRISNLKIENKFNAQTLKDDVNFYFNQLKFLGNLLDNFEQYRVEADNIVKRAFQAL